ncbi:DUF4112 domain-containing protein [Sphingomonas sp. HITSZ_GF]|uniref:DUF4112 domain-containing protein n=1 Tax=Sphingomonas sp. HITSZ_GF TaxID=3037247 RepID=UPI00240E745A|nr:DUF4112 domain-containing protein [Sphingomonas sp. HITSZ_GF]MDG2534828.1 DUF4112 domain-containing protein [Sphingomonas sp. HITSZ_GF]
MASANLPLGRHAGDVRRRIEMMEHLLERSVPIPGLKTKVGLDAILGLVPVGGDVIAALLGLYIVWEARNLKMPATTMARMLGNVGFDWLIGLVPVVGDAADFVFKSNSRNLKLIKRHLDKHHPGTSTINHR